MRPYMLSRTASSDRKTTFAAPPVRQFHDTKGMTHTQALQELPRNITAIQKNSILPFNSFIAEPGVSGSKCGLEAHSQPLSHACFAIESQVCKLITKLLV